MLEDVDPSVVCLIVDKGEEIFSPTQGSSIHLPTDITMNKIQWFCCSVSFTGWKNGLCLLASDACFTKLDILGVVEMEYIYEVVSGKLLQALHVEMSVTLVPQYFL